MLCGDNEDEVFLGRSITRHQQMSEETAKKIDTEIKTNSKQVNKNIIKNLIEKFKNLNILNSLMNKIWLS